MNTKELKWWFFFYPRQYQFNDNWAIREYERHSHDVTHLRFITYSKNDCKLNSSIWFNEVPSHRWYSFGFCALNLKMFWFWNRNFSKFMKLMTFFINQFFIITALTARQNSLPMILIKCTDFDCRRQWLTQLATTSATATIIVYREKAQTDDRQIQYNLLPNSISMSYVDGNLFRV